MRAVDILRLNKKKEEGYKIWGVEVDYTNSNPLTSVTYTHNAIGMTPGSSAWDNTPIFSGIKPCLLNNGSVNYYLDPNNFSKKADGVTNADITSGTDGDVMIEIPKLGYKIETTGNTLKVQVTNNPNAGADGFCYYGHTRTTEGDRDFLYVSAYKGYVASNKLRSLSGKTPLGATSLEEFRDFAQQNGSGYDVLSFYPLTLLQVLYLIKYKNLDSQTALGEGYTNKSNTSYANTGGTNTKGMYWGGADTEQMKFAGVEDLWGNIFNIIEGFTTMNDTGYGATAFKDFNSTGDGYNIVAPFDIRLEDVGTSAGIKKVYGTNELGFIPSEVGGSLTTPTYFCDNTNWGSNIIMRPLHHGGTHTDAKGAGVFMARVRIGFNTHSANYNGRLMYL